MLMKYTKKKLNKNKQVKKVTNIKKKKPINKTVLRRKEKINLVIEKRYKIVIGLIILLMVMLMILIK